ncbi:MULTISPECIES: hypothetical protein [Alphaproteobacteria]|uniref:Fenitrothion hydrolase n=2 Tax=Alphaproteobacteria TaxID=28211 RepID=A0A512HMH2_9HYPH|nr:MULTISPECIES: hypothetical protein [Alphaproteobacteria]GEO86639.1 hypothetical protein RNA01_35710 [Ciceribacter naphthalenivorans]GLR23631.1 hypothetical protein GCM10007920_34230 [Ciceribacter naphthalenivorans]GLT06487.1 hypothetical protein GCM10007926_34230 [Sphingomonas psychrolutea]
MLFDNSRRVHNLKPLYFALASLSTTVMATDAGAHGTERGLVMLLPTEYYLTGGAIAVAASFTILLLLPEGWFARAARASHIFSGVFLPPVTATSLLSFLFLAFLVATGLYSTGDPLENPLPLFVWTFFWVAFTLLQAVLGNLWPWLNPWTGPLALLRKLSDRPLGKTPFLTLPPALGYTSAIAVFFLFAWYELISLAPEDPSGLALAVTTYWVLTLAAMILFGEAEWTKRGEPFSVYFRMIGLLAPLSASPPSDEETRGTIRLSWPGQRCVDLAPPPISAALFLLLTLGTASFDGFSETFTWLSAIGINPLEFPGRSAVTVANTFGLIAAPMVLALLYLSAVLLGARIAGERSFGAMLKLASHLVYSIVPISIAFHGAHYLSLMLMNGQYLYAVISDPFALGWNLFGTAEWHVTASFLIDIEGVKRLWAAQTIIIVVGHCIGILLAHMIALQYFTPPHRATVSQIFLALVMVFYTVFGLWLLSTPTVG